MIHTYDIYFTQFINKITGNKMENEDCSEDSGRVKFEETVRGRLEDQTYITLWQVLYDSDALSKKDIVDILMEHIDVLPDIYKE